MRGLVALIAVLGLLFGFAFADRKFGNAVREFYDQHVRWMFPVSFIGFFAACIGLLFLIDPAKQTLGVLVGYNALMALGLNIVVGYAGLLDLGYVAFFAFGAYTMGILSGAGPIHAFHLSFWEILPIGIVVAIIAGVILGGPTLRLRGDYLAIVTLGFGEIVRTIAENLDHVTNGSKGIKNIPGVSMHLKDVIHRGRLPTWLRLKHDFALDPRPYCIIAIVFIAIAILFVRALNHSRVGRAWAAIREDEVAAEAMGVPTLKYKLWAFAIGAAVGSLGGMLFAANVGFIDPTSFGLDVSIFVLASVVLGGIGSMGGAIVGAVLINVVPEMLRSLGSLGVIGQRLLDARFGIFGLVLVIMMIFRPQGVVPSRRRAAELKGGTEETKGPTGGDSVPAEAVPNEGGGGGHGAS
ncbi:MAG: branched-chain amino acid ABC transporter permease [Actinomycetota bacterium]